MSDDDFFDSGPSAPATKGNEFGRGPSQPRPSSGLPRQSSHTEYNNLSPNRNSEGQIEVMESRGSKLYTRTSYGGNEVSQEFVSDTKKVEWDDESESDSDSSNHQTPRVSRKDEKPRARHQYSDSDHSFSDASKSSRSRSNSRSRSRSSSATSSWDSGTDVSPLQSPDRRPTRAPRRQYSDILKPQNRSRESNRRKEKDIRDVHDEDNLDLQHILEALMDLESQSQRLPPTPVKGKKKAGANYSYTDARIQAIERDNQRLLQKILELQKGKAKKKVAYPTAQVTRLHHSTINREREQRKIEKENMRIMRRLQSIKPTPGHSREEQLSSYWRQATYGVPKFAIKAANAPDPDELYALYHARGERTRPTSAYSITSKGKSRSRPTSAVQTRSRPWSATSNTSMRSAASVRSAASFRTASSESSKARLRPRSAKLTLSNRPAWDERW